MVGHQNNKGSQVRLLRQEHWLLQPYSSFPTDLVQTRRCTLGCWQATRCHWGGAGAAAGTLLHMRCSRVPAAAPARPQWQRVQAPQCFAEAWQQPQCAIATLHSPVHLVHTKPQVCTVQFTLQSVHTDPYCALYTVQSTLHIICSDSRVWTVNCIL